MTSSDWPVLNLDTLACEHEVFDLNSMAGIIMCPFYSRN